MVKILFEVSAVKSEVLRCSDWVNLGTSRPFSLSSLVTSVQTGNTSFRRLVVPSCTANGFNRHYFDSLSNR